MSSKACTQWLLILLVTALVSFALGMTLVGINFQVADFVKDQGVFMLVPVLVGIVFYALWLRNIIQLTRSNDHTAEN